MARFTLHGVHEVDGVSPGDEIDVPDEPTARRLAKRGAIAWGDYVATYLEPKPKKKPPVKQAAKRKGDQ